MNPQYLNYDPVCDSGINVGYNRYEQTVGVGESKKYLWYADQEYGICNIQSFGDIRNHRYHGLFGVIIIEPAGAKAKHRTQKTPAKRDTTIARNALTTD